MFDLEQRIMQWRQTLAGALRGRPEAVEELEAHLREEVQRLMGSGQAPEQAWETAVQRLGTPQELAGEFGKLPPEPAAWLPGRLVSIALGCLGCLMGYVLLSRLLHGETQPLLAVHVVAVTVGYTAIFALGVLAIWSLLVRAVRGWDEPHAASLRYYALRLTLVGFGLTAMGVVLGGLWARENLGRFWGWDPRELGGLAVVAWFGVMLASLRQLPSGWLPLMLLGVIGNIVVSLSWFAPPLFDKGLHSYGSGPIKPVLIAFILSQLLTLLLALVPPRRVSSQGG